jgi:hypothetical protein
VIATSYNRINTYATGFCRCRLKTNRQFGSTVTGNCLNSWRSKSTPALSVAKAKAINCLLENLQIRIWLRNHLGARVRTLAPMDKRPSILLLLSHRLLISFVFRRKLNEKHSAEMSHLFSIIQNALRLKTIEEGRIMPLFSLATFFRRFHKPPLSIRLIY